MVDLAHAERYLNKAGDNAEAQFNRAMLNYSQGSTEEAMAMLLELSRGSGDVAKKAKTALESIQELNKIKDKNFKLL